MQSRKYLQSSILSIGSLKRKYEYASKEIQRVTSTEEYDRTIKHFDALIANLTKELSSLPIGYRYTGIFYIKNSYTIPTTFEKHDGVVFMREDLISWQKEIWEEMQKNTKLWAKGYWYGVEATWPFKGNLEFNPEINSLLEAIYCLTLSKQAFINASKELKMAAKNHEQIIIGSLPEIAMEIYDFCLTKREEYSPKVTPQITNDFKVGHNEACYCGSGKKFKKCCLH